MRDLYSHDAEIAVLNILLTNPAEVYNLGNLKPFMFGSTVHSAIFECILEIEQNNLVPEKNLIVSYLEGKGKLISIGGEDYITYLFNQTYNRDNLQEFIRQIKNNYKTRSLISLTSSIADRIVPNEIDTTISSIRNTLDSLEDTSGGESTVDIKSASKDTWDEIVDRLAHPGIRGFTTGFSEFDLHTGGINPGDLWIVAGRPSMGKEQPIYSRVYTKDGYKLMGDISIGDLVIGADGLEHAVTQIFPQGIKPIYRVYFDDETFADCGLDHLWWTKSRKERKSNKDYSSKTLKEIIDSGIILDGKRSNHSIPIAQPVNFSKKNLKLDPYLLGILLGDGNLTENSIRLTIADKDIVEYISSILPDEDIIKYGSGHEYHIINSNNKYKGVSTETKTILCDYGLCGKTHTDKFIPEEYLLSSIEDRISLLQGLLDSGGYVVTPRNNFIEFSTTSIKLRDQILQLVRSLGGKCSSTSRIGSYGKVTTIPNYRVWISFANPDIKPFKCLRKSSKYVCGKRLHNKYITHVEYIGNFEAKCIMVDSKEHLYLTDNFIVTHNSAWACNSLLYGAKAGLGELMFSREMRKTVITERILSIETGVPISDIRLGTLNQLQMDSISKGISNIKDLPIYIDSNFESDLGYIVATIKKYVRHKAVKVIHIDYIQLLAERSADQTAELGRISRAMKLLANDLGIGIVVYSQLNRLVEARPDKRPILSDLRQSGNLEEDADIVNFLYRDDYYNDKTDAKGVQENIIRKNRNGSIGTLFFKFQPDTNKVTCK